MAERNKILIVEDDAETAEMLSTYFESKGYHVSTVAWGSDAIEFCQHTVPDLIIEDIRLPDINGYEVVRELRKNLRTSQVPIVFLTKRQDRKDRIAGLQLGAIDYITKPFDVKELYLRVQNALSRASYTSLVSPVTGLPGMHVARERLEALLAEGRWAVLCVAIGGLEAFSDAYGFVAGDDVLRAVGLIVSNVVDETGDLDDFVGHIDKAEFLLVTRENKARNMYDKLVSRLERTFDYFYPIKDIESGHVEAPMTAEVGIVVPSSGPYDRPDAILDAVRKSREVVVVSPVAKSR
jgi:PleD family two-component response regulator